MKKVILAFLSIAVCALFASAQIIKGSALLGGGLNFGSNKSEAPNGSESKQTTYAVNLSAGSAVKENTIVGGSLNYGHSIQKGESLTGPITTSLSTCMGNMR